MHPQLLNTNRSLRGRLLASCMACFVFVGCSPNPMGNGNSNNINDNNSVGNHAPIANAGADQTVIGGATVTLDASGSNDQDGDALAYSWEQTAGTQVTLNNASTKVATFTAPGSASTLAFELTVNDGQTTARDSISISVLLVGQTAEVIELSQSIPNDPAVTGHAPTEWVVPVPTDIPVRPPEEGEMEEFKEQYEEHSVQFVPVIEEELMAGASRTVELPVSGPSGLSGMVQWLGTSIPLEVNLSMDDSNLSTTGEPYNFGGDRGGVLLLAQSMGAGSVTLSVTNTTGSTVKVKVALASSAL